jgi:hypothetical protein
MSHQRYFVEENAEGIPEIHRHVLSCHWYRMGNGLIFGYAMMSVDKLEKLQDHQLITLMPSLHDPTPLQEHFKTKKKETQHQKLAEHFGLQPQHHMGHLVAEMHKRGLHGYGPQI